MGAIKYGFGSRRIRYNILGAVLLVLAMGAYVFFLNVEDHKLAQRDATLARTDPAQYLNEMRTTRGFATYVAEFTRVYGFDHWRKSPPPFLLGRWALDTEPRRVNDEYIPTNCIDALVVEDGWLKTTGTAPSERHVTYRIVGNTVEARAANGTTIPIRLVSYDMNLHHVEVSLPGHSGTLYGYECR
jgi:hypothetical protein